MSLNISFFFSPDFSHLLPLITCISEYSVGDSLRAVYDGLARDPNSLANLDQDLPNYAQHSVPIHSLPQEWLWCETWCSDKTKEAVSQIMEKLITPSLIHPTHTFPITG